MRLLCLLVALTAAPAEAQPAPADAPGITSDQEAALFGLPVLATVGAIALLVRTDVPAVALGLPLVPVAAVCATGAAFSISGDCSAAFRSTASWSVPGYTLVGLGLIPWIDGETRFASVLFGGLYLLVVPPVAAIASYRQSVGVAPAVISDPATRRFAPGVQLRLGL